MTHSKQIIIYFDYVPTRVPLMAYQQVRDALAVEEPVIHTLCLNFFCFDRLDQGYEVLVLKQDGSYIRLSELLDNTGAYTQKHLHHAHNACKILIGGGLKFQPPRVVPPCGRCQHVRSEGASQDSPWPSAWCNKGHWDGEDPDDAIIPTVPSEAVCGDFEPKPKPKGVTRFPDGGYALGLPVTAADPEPDS